MLAVTEAVEIAWQIAADEAIRSGHLSIEPLHLLIGMFSLGKVLSPDSLARTRPKGPALVAVTLEWRRIASILEGMCADPVALRRAARKAMGQSEREVLRSLKLSRSVASHRIFSRAEKIARDFNRSEVNLAALLAATLESDDVHLRDLLIQEQLNAVGINSALTELPESPSRTSTLISTTDVRDLKDGSGTARESANDELSQISVVIDAAQSPMITASDELRTAERLALFYDLPLQFGLEVEHCALLNTVLAKIVEVVPGAERAALLVRDRKSDALLLQAHIPPGDPAVSLTLAERAIRGKEGFIWNRHIEDDLTPSLSEQRSEAGMYVPLVWRGDALGVICVDNRGDSDSFSEDDLRLFVAVAHHAAMAIANHQLQEDLRKRSILLERMLTNFSPRIRQKLLDKATNGRLALGGEKSEVTVLFSDIRGFTRMTASMDAEDIVEMLNHYFSVLVETLFRYDGTIDKFIGDSILAVFGSPEADSAQHEKAVRAALEMQSEIVSLNKLRSGSGRKTCEIGIGIHCGEVLHGFIGSADRMEFTVVGDPVNRAARYCAGAKAGEVLISTELHQHVWRQVEVEALTIATKHEGDFSAYRLKCIKPHAQSTP
jgi:adenylate cyclase